jgi:hypothetical protein
VTTAVLLALAVAADPADHFARKVRPVLALCVECHSGKDADGGLDLTTRAGALKGGLHGPALKPGDEASPLLQRVAAGKMPPKKPLNAEQVADLRRWVADGAAWDGTIVKQPVAAKRAGPDWWSLQPVRRPAVPAVRDRAWVRTPLDAFVLARLEAEGLHPTPEADRATLIRRVTLDLTGLPPTPDEIDAFVKDAAPDAWEKVIDRLLASPRYGERWGRHWLDVARFGESQGFERDKLRDHAWRYRDYVIRSFTADKPYAQFIKEQIAGDVLPGAGADGVVATGFLVVGPYDEVGQTALSPSVRSRARDEELEERLGTLAQAFLGLTLHCARCHDHKFDPIPQADYYRARAAFDGTHPGDRPALSAEAVQAKERLPDLEKRLAALDADARRRLGGKSSGPEPFARWSFAADGRDDLGRLPGTLHGGAVVRDGRLVLDGKGAYLVTAPLGRDLTAKTFEAWVSPSRLDQRGGGVLSLEAPDGAVFDAIVFGERQPGKWIAGSEGFRRTRDLAGPAETAKPGELVHVAAAYAEDGTISVYRNGAPYGAAYNPGKPVTFAARGARVLIGMRHTGGGNAFFEGAVAEARLHDRALTAAEVAASFRAGPSLPPLAEALKALTPEERTERDRLAAEVARARGLVAAAPLAYAVTPKQPGPTHRLIRGDPDKPAEEVTAGGLSVIQAPSPDFGLGAASPEGQRRLAFAEWVAHPDNPLPARVMVNRVWHGHFGQGIVRTPSDFGFNGDRPSHPELFDWLAAEFVAGGSSVKKLHRLILTSATYRQGWAFDRAAAAKDADNRLLWRFAPRRLEGEAVRDGMLFVSGKLHEKVGGPSFRPFTVTVFNSNFYTLTDPDEPDFNRRSVYRMAVISAQSPLLSAFDCPEPSARAPRRAATTTPQQALALMNNPFVWRQADALAARAVKEAGPDVAGQVRRAYLLTLGRPPRGDEAERAAAVATEHGLRHVAWALLDCSEFLYLR